jgi:hypothetical protein
MANNRPLSWTTRLNWLLDFAVFAGAVLASLTGIYFLFFVSGGYQGGRNPTYGISLLFDRTTWGNLHTWGGVLMIAAVLFHLTIHLDWIGMMSRKMVSTMRGASRLSRGAKINVLVDVVIAISFVLVALSGIYFLFAGVGGYQNGHNPGWDPMFLLSRSTWDLIHTWAGTALVVAAVIHLAIHWRWVTKVTAKMLGLPLGKPQPQSVRS